jgi:ATP-dependent DNA helicase RecG
MKLTTPISDTGRLISTQKKALEKLGIHTVADLLYHFPTRYTEISELKSIARLEYGLSATVYGRITSLEAKKAHFKKISYAEGEIEDPTGKLKVIWWNQAYLAKTLQVGALVKLSGSVQKQNSGNKLYMNNPEVEKATELPLGTENSLFEISEGEQSTDMAFGIYPESRGITSRWMHHKIQKLLRELPSEELSDPLPDYIYRILCILTD